MKYKYHDYTDWCNKRGERPMLPDYFKEIRNDVLYKPSDIELITGLSKETIRRWFRNSKIQNHSASNAYKAYGKDYKDFLFNRPLIINPLKGKYREFFLEKEDAKKEV